MMLDMMLLNFMLVLLLGFSNSFTSAQEIVNGTIAATFQPSSTYSYLNESAPSSSPTGSSSSNSTNATFEPSVTSSPSESSPSSSPSSPCGIFMNSSEYIIACPTLKAPVVGNAPGFVIYFSIFLVFLICAIPEAMRSQRRRNEQNSSNEPAQNALSTEEEKEAREKQIIANFEIKTIETVDIQPLLEQKEYNSSAFRVERGDSNNQKEEGKSSTIVDKLPNEERRDDFDVEKGISLQRQRESNSASFQIERGDGNTKEEHKSSTSMDKSPNVEKSDDVDLEKGVSEIDTEPEELGTDDDTSTTSEESTTLMDQFLSYWRGQKVERAECSICLERYKAGDTICVSKHPDCNHIFHKDCAAQWLARRNDCPLCRIDLLKEI
eukprot:scaffold763_cov98-Cylindrotheca_fusiformis.AAC.8